MSIRDIAKEVGITESSIYSHYKGKDAIMDAIIDSLILEFQTKSHDLNIEFLLKQHSAVEVLIILSTSFMERLKSPFLHQICRLMCIELYQNTKIAQFFRDQYIRPSYQIWSDIFQQIQRHGTVTIEDPMQFALEYFDYNIYILFDCFLVRYGTVPYPTLIHEGLAKLVRHIRFMFQQVEIAPRLK